MDAVVKTKDRGWALAVSCGLALPGMSVGNVNATPVVDTAIVAIQGQATPENDGTFDFFWNFAPHLNDIGQVAFSVELTGTNGGFSDYQGIYRGDGTAEGLVRIVRLSDEVPEGNGTFRRLGFSTFAAADFASGINNAGQVAFLAETNSPYFTRYAHGQYLGDGSPGGLVNLAREGQPLPSSGESFFQFSSSTPELNDAGQIAFVTSVSDDSTPFTYETRIYRGDGTSSGDTTIAAVDQSLPDSDGTFRSFTSRRYVINDAGQVAFNATLQDTPGGTTDDQGIYRGDGTPGSLTKVVREGQAAPDGNGSFVVPTFITPMINNAGQVAFYSTLSSTTDGNSDDSGLFRSDSTGGGLDTLIRKGQLLPTGHSAGGFLYHDELNNAGQMLFATDLMNPADGQTVGQGLYLTDGTAEGLFQIARDEEITPEGDAEFLEFHPQGLNDQGQALVVADLGILGSSDVVSGIYVHDDDGGLIKIAREGDAFLGSTLSYVGFSSTLNNAGQVAYRFSLEDGRSGIALATIIDTLLGDYNNNGIVDAADYTIWQDSFGSTTDLAADGNGNGIIDAADYTVWQDNFGNSNIGTSTLAILPEPGTIGLLGLSGLLCTHRRARG
ncbi:DUF7453 family protein [Algisphaera agarilytica]|uniref:PEP-CTERM protein-sorting domain-containing protein n=1 Tax=Algisphaera agarilytica TaxID=1385975 RepID=A0A7X0LKC8_9BACT|nr:choice-of-anchor tandem repeat NxxGxxAF-containing protein [Algisphaera agarilytica]MBB6429782.1 hypothetical protein [Algisphaera agarilytica]